MIIFKLSHLTGNATQLLLQDVNAVICIQQVIIFLLQPKLTLIISINVQIAVWVSDLQGKIGSQGMGPGSNWG